MRLDTIVAPITGNQPAAVAIVRLSGPESWLIASRLFDRWPDPVVSHLAHFGHVGTGDEALALPFAEGRSYTGEESVEFSIHGSPASVRALVDACMREGARAAEPGEFTRRAFMNGRMDLSQAEGVRDTVLAQTEAQLRQANLHRDGVLRREISKLRESAIKLLAAVEASVDFSEEVGELNREAGLKQLGGLLASAESLMATAGAGRILRDGLRIAIVGPPNAGKSSLLNALLGHERVIVSEVPGTTRDYVEEQADLGGVLCVLFDTAGLRESVDKVESIGIQRARTIAANADEVWYVYDSSIGWRDSDDEACETFGRPVLVLANKADLASAARTGDIPVSAVTRQGFEHLFAHVAAKILDADSRPFVNDRHAVALEYARQGLLSSKEALECDMPDDLLAVGLQEAIARYGEITGETATVDIVDRIFHDFCVGK
jgi:tRNA modification GTPase